jgi:hypothetical protein
MDENQFTTGEKESESRPPITENCKILCEAYEKLDPQSFANENLSRVRAVAFAMIGLARSAEELKDTSLIQDSWAQVEVLATIILEQEDQVRENLGDFMTKVREIKAQVQAQ